jgi:hypothetical protein
MKTSNDLSRLLPTVTRETWRTGVHDLSPLLPTGYVRIQGRGEVEATLDDRNQT